jgi:hypothetical protein
MKIIDLSRQFDRLNKRKDNLTFLELAITRIDCPFHQIFWTKVENTKKMVDEDGNLIILPSDNAFVIAPNVKYTEHPFVKMPIPFKKMVE